MSDNVDRHFIEQMIPHHEGAIEMANTALEKAEHQEIKNLSQSIIQSQTAEIELMEDWYKNWYGTDVPVTFFGHNNGMGYGMRGGWMPGNNLNLGAAKPFDKAFIEQMIPHHQMALMMAQMLKNGTNREEMRQLADDIIDAQSKEIDQMTAWYNTWYK